MSKSQRLFFKCNPTLQGLTRVDLPSAVTIMSDPNAQIPMSGVDKISVVCKYNSNAQKLPYIQLQLRWKIPEGLRSRAATRITDIPVSVLARELSSPIQEFRFRTYSERYAALRLFR
jgi:hypothetical protein